jgi:Ca2+-binding EF-hand superfamily protein
MTDEEFKFTLFEEICETVEKKTREYFKKADLNGDGSISKEEWLYCEKLYSKAKKESFKENDKLKEFQSFDTNKDGALSEEELVSGTIKALEGLKSNLDLISDDELIGFAKSIVVQIDDYINAVEK